MQTANTEHWSRYPRLETLNLLYQVDDDDLNDVVSATREPHFSRQVPAEDWITAMSRISEELGVKMGLYGRKRILRYDTKVLITPVSDYIYGTRDCYREQVWTEQTGHRSTVLTREDIADILEKRVVNLYPVTDARRMYRLFRASHDEAVADVLSL